MNLQKKSFGQRKLAKVAIGKHRMSLWEADKQQSADIGRQPKFLKKKFIFWGGHKVAGNSARIIPITSKCSFRSYELISFIYVPPYALIAIFGKFELWGESQFFKKKTFFFSKIDFFRKINFNLKSWKIKIFLNPLCTSLIWA